MTYSLYKIDPDWVFSAEAAIISCCFAGLSIIISVMHISKHLFNYSMPGIQIYVLRILLICPVYAISSALAILLGNSGLYAEVIRDVYESLVIYSFLNLILEYCGGETDCVYQIENEPALVLPFPLCFLRPVARDTRLMRFCQRGVLQFIIIKPIMAALGVIMIATGLFFHPVYSWIETVVYNISYGWALYCLMVFYVATKILIKKFRPVLKFATVKIIIFATYYQSLAVTAAPLTPEQAFKWNDFILCMEMIIFSTALSFAFPVKEFQFGIPDTHILSNVSEMLTVKDIMVDVYHNFMPVYHDYAIQRSEFEAPNSVRTKTYIAGNIDPVALEMSKRYRGRNRRLAFNALLRGNNPIQSKPRSISRNDQSDSLPRPHSLLEKKAFDRLSSVHGDREEKDTCPEIAVSSLPGFDEDCWSCEGGAMNGIVVNAVLALGRPRQLPSEALRTDEEMDRSKQVATAKSLNYISGEDAYRRYLIASGGNSSPSPERKSSTSSSSLSYLEVDRSGSLQIGANDNVGKTSSIISYATKLASKLWRMRAIDRDNKSSHPFGESSSDSLIDKGEKDDTEEPESGRGKWEMSDGRVDYFTDRSNPLTDGGFRGEEVSEDEIEVESPLFTHVIMPFTVDPRESEAASRRLGLQEEHRSRKEIEVEEKRRMDEEAEMIARQLAQEEKKRLKKEKRLAQKKANWSIDWGFDSKPSATASSADHVDSGSLGLLGNAGRGSVTAGRDNSSSNSTGGRETTDEYDLEQASLMESLGGVTGESRSGQGSEKRDWKKGTMKNYKLVKVVKIEDLPPISSIRLISPPAPGQLIRKKDESAANVDHSGKVNRPDKLNAATYVTHGEIRTPQPSATVGREANGAKKKNNRSEDKQQNWSQLASFLSTISQDEDDDIQWSEFSAPTLQFDEEDEIEASTADEPLKLN